MGNNARCHAFHRIRTHRSPGLIPAPRREQPTLQPQPDGCPSCNPIPCDPSH